MTPLPKQGLTPGDEFTRRYLNSFRGEPAISRFDWPFTPSHKSSANFSTLVGSVLQLVSPSFNLPMVTLTGFLTYTLQLNAQLRLGFPSAPHQVNLATEYKSLTHYTKRDELPQKKRLPLLVRTRFQVLFHSLAGVLFAFPSRYWFTIGQSGVFSLGGWSPIFRQDTTCPALLIELTICAFLCTGLSPCIACLSRCFH